MPLFEIEPGENGAIRAVPETTYATEGIWERRDLQRLLRDHIEAISPDTLIVAEEFSVWQDSDRRIDLLGVDKDANLVVVELKRDNEGGHMELQALRYAAMVSPLTFSKVVDEYARYLTRLGRDGDAHELLLGWLKWDEPRATFNAKTRIVLAAANFSSEITTTVLWLNNYGLDMRCIRMTPYKHAERVLVNVQQVIPLPEAADYQVQIQEKVQEERAARSSGDGKFTLTLGAETLTNLSQRGAVLATVNYLREHGVNPEQIRQALSDVYPVHLLWAIAEGTFDTSEAFRAAVHIPHKYTWYLYLDADDERFAYEGRTYALRSRWGGGAAPIGLSALRDAFSNGSTITISFLQGSIS